MKSFFCLIALLSSLQALAQDLDKTATRDSQPAAGAERVVPGQDPRVMSESQCVPTRNSDGKVVNCDKPAKKIIGKKPVQLQAKPGDVVNKINGEPVNSISDAMKGYNKAPNLNVTEDDMKTCLATIYLAQKDHYAKAGTYARDIQKYVSKETCPNMTVFTSLADQNFFTVTAQAGSEVWTVDQNKTFKKVQ